MDPNANLKEQLELARMIRWAIDTKKRPDIYDEANRLAELVLTMDEWLSKGGYSPRPWAWKFR